MLQKVTLCTEIKKGSFIYNKALGTDILEVDIQSPQALQTATVLLNEALITEKGFKAEVESIDKTEGGKLRVRIAVKNKEETRRVQVTVNADL